MAYIGVTGTDGKTTTCTMIYHLLLKLGYKPGLVSTVSAKINGKDIDTGFHTTTPSSQDLYALLKRMENEGCTHAIVESTSHGLAMGRLAGLKYHAIAYTNITSEHLDYHKTWENYYAAKETLLTEHTFTKTITVLNKDDAKAYTLLTKVADRRKLPVYTYSTQEDTQATLVATSIKEDPTISFSIGEVPVSLPIIGTYNVSNALAALLLTSQLLQKNTAELAPLLADFQTVTGRMQVLQTKPYSVIVDFAHTTNALEQALTTMRHLLPANKKLIAVFGCAGKRDYTKRTPMGEVAGRLADITILTAEDPRSEHLKDINDEIEKGWQKTKQKNSVLYRIDDETLLADTRKIAIEKALELATEGDIIIIAGKAHEQTNCFGTIEYPWSDISDTLKLLNQPANA
jgi:UDP-N-acetylmuramoyl-L-alanyl-D-glutamate--2,6-diaminopimelate ligase